MTMATRAVIASFGLSVVASGLIRPSGSRWLCRMVKPIRAFQKPMTSQGVVMQKPKSMRASSMPKPSADNSRSMKATSAAIEIRQTVAKLRRRQRRLWLGRTALAARAAEDEAFTVSLPKDFCF